MSHSEFLSACHFLCWEPSEIWREFWRQTFSCESPAIFWRGERAHSWQRGQPVQDSVDSKSCSAVQILLSQYTVYLYKVLLFRLPKYKTRTSGPGQCGQQIVHSADTMDTVQCNVMHCNAQKNSLSCTEYDCLNIEVEQNTVQNQYTMQSTINWRLSWQRLWALYSTVCTN